MADQTKRGTAESSWLAARRCLAMLLRVQQGPASKQALIAAVYQLAGEDAYGYRSGQPLNKRFRNDLERLEAYFQIKIGYNKAEKGYVIKERGRPLLNLPHRDIETLTFLADTFQEGSPRATEVQQLIDRLVDWLPAERQKLFQRLEGQLPTADWRLRDSDDIPPGTWQIVLEAWQAKQELQFDYLSSKHEDGRVRQHHIQPWDLYFTERGHWCLYGYCLFNDGPNGAWHPNDYLPYRVGRIVPGSVRLLPRKLPPVRPNGRPRVVIFELAPAIARFGVSERKELLEPPQIIEVDEGWVRVEGRTHDVFSLARNLLYYGRHCRVLGGRELLAEVRQLVRDLAGIYQ